MSNAFGSRCDEVLEDARNGDAYAFEELFTELQPRLLRFLRSQEPTVADDLAAEVWMAIAKGIARFDGDWSDFRAWAFAIARRRLADHRRTAVRRRTDVVAADVFELHPAGDETEQEVLDRLSGQQAADLVASVLNGEQAEVVLLRVLGDLDVDQVAAIMQRSPNWVRVTQHRALQKLARRLGPRKSVMR